MKKTPRFWVFGFLTYSIDTFGKKNASKRPTLPSAGSEKIYSRLYGVATATANLDDPYRNPYMNNEDHRVGPTPENLGV